MQPVRTTSLARSRFGARGLLLVLAACLVPVLMTVGCGDDDKAALPPGAVPTIVAVDAVTLTPPKTDAGDLVGGCCSFTVGITFAPLPGDELIREGYVQWALLGETRFAYPASEATGAGANKKVSFTAEVPPQLVARGAKLAFTVVLVTGRGERSAAAGGTLTIN